MMLNTSDTLYRARDHVCVQIDKKSHDGTKTYIGESECIKQS